MWVLMIFFLLSITDVDMDVIFFLLSTTDVGIDDFLFAIYRWRG